MSMEINVMKVRIAILSLALSALAASLCAQVRSGTVEISPFYGYLFGGSFPAGSTSQFPDIRANVEDHGTYGVGIGYFVNSAIEIETRWSHTATGLTDHHNSVGTFTHEPRGPRVAAVKIDYLR